MVPPTIANVYNAAWTAKEFAMTPNCSIVLTDNNPMLPRAIFFGISGDPIGNAAAIEWRDAHAGGAAVRAARVDSYGLVIVL